MSGKIREIAYTDISGQNLSDKDINAIRRSLPEYFNERAAGLGQRDAKLQHISSGLLLVYLLKESGLQVSDVKIGAGPHGKPGFENPNGLYFNLSHSEDLILLSLCDTGTGCDIQKIKPGSSRIAKRFFTPEENDLIKSARDGDKDRVFTRLWARKESYIKALGEGLSRDLKSFSVLSDSMPGGYVLTGYELDDYAAALCLHKDERDAGQSVSFPDLRFIPFQNLVNVL